MPFSIYQRKADRLKTTFQKSSLLKEKTLIVVVLSRRDLNFRIRWDCHSVAGSYLSGRSESRGIRQRRGRVVGCVQIHSSRAGRPPWFLLLHRWDCAGWLVHWISGLHHEWESSLHQVRIDIDVDYLLVCLVNKFRCMGVVFLFLVVFGTRSAKRS